jgi:hypothetical protein
VDSGQVPYCGDVAILLYFEKVREDERSVEYAYGYPELDRRLVLDKADPWAAASEDRDAGKVLFKITKYVAEHGAWPSSGAYAA